jgi:hypothetical protein
MRTYFLLFAFLLGASSSLWSKDVPKARIARSLDDYADMLSFKDSEEVIYVLEDDSKTLQYGMFEDDENPQDSNALSSFDVLYEDVPILYESALSMMAKGDWEQALELLKRSSSEKTPITKKNFSSTEVYRNYVPHKEFLCHLNLGDQEKALELFEKISKNSKAHSRYRVMLNALPVLVKMEKGREALKVSEELFKIRLPRSQLVDAKIQQALALSLTKKYQDARTALADLVNKYGEDYNGLGEKVKEAETTILVYHEKNYSKAVRYFEGLLKKDRKQATSDLYIKLAYCYGQQNKWEESRWNYLQAYLVGSLKGPELKDLIAKIEKTNSRINSEKGNDALENFFGQVKQAL